MKGVVFKYLEEFVTDSFNIETWQKILDNTELFTKDGVFISLGNYPDEDLLALVTTGSKLSGIAIPDLVYKFGYFLLNYFARDYNTFFSSVTKAKDFLASIHCVIHVEVKKLYPGAETPHFDYEDPSSDVLVMKYTSKRQLCALVEGLLEGTANYFNEIIEHQQVKCMHKGDSYCEFHLMFKSKELEQV